MKVWMYYMSLSFVLWRSKKPVEPTEEEEEEARILCA